MYLKIKLMLVWYLSQSKGKKYNTKKYPLQAFVYKPVQKVS
jgi:hypothetical protein